MATKKFEIVIIEGVSFTVDESVLKSDEKMYLNATDMAKAFGKKPSDYLRQSSTKEYIAELKKILQVEDSRLELVRVVHGGKNHGTWMHHELALDFAMWLSPRFKAKFLRYIRQRMDEAIAWRTKRLEVRTGFAPLTEAIKKSHDDPQFYHYKNEVDLINKIVFGMIAKKYREIYGCNPRDDANEFQLKMVKLLQISNTGLIEAGFDYEQRKEMLERIFKNNQIDNMLLD